MTTCLRQPLLSPPQQIPIQSLLYKMTTCLTQPVITFFVSQMKKNLSKMTTTKLYPAKNRETIIWKQCVKNKFLPDYIYSIATLYITHSLFNVLKTGQLNLTFVFPIT